MKELSTEEKAKRYNEALERARKLQENSKGMILKKWLWNIFPELKESRDNRIMKVIRGWIYTRPASFFDNGISKEEILAWLEKQGEQKPVDSYCQENCKGFQETGKCFADGDCKAKREAESTNKVEPKFKVGDWIIFNDFTLYIKEVVKGYYRTKSVSGIAISYGWDIDNIARLWTIEDAKEGDILAFDNETIVIFKDLYNKTSFHSYCHIEDGVFNISKDDMPDWWEGEGFYPATRKQRDILFSKMKKAGYEWHINKKELRKKE